MPDRHGNIQNAAALLKGRQLDVTLEVGKAVNNSAWESSKKGGQGPSTHLRAPLSATAAVLWPVTFSSRVA